MVTIRTFCFILISPLLPVWSFLYICLTSAPWLCFWRGLFLGFWIFCLWSGSVHRSFWCQAVYVCFCVLTVSTPVTTRQTPTLKAAILYPPAGPPSCSHLSAVSSHSWPARTTASAFTFRRLINTISKLLQGGVGWEVRWFLHWTPSVTSLLHPVPPLHLSAIKF